VRISSATILILFLLTVVAAPPGVAARQGGAALCPTVSVSCDEGLSPDKPSSYSATVRGGDPSVNPTYRWGVSAGRITGGQGTARISVDAEGSNSLTVSVEVFGYPAACATSASCGWIVCNLLPSRKFDEYGDIGTKDEQARLSNFSAELKNDPTSLGYVIAYGGRRSPPRSALSRGERARSYLVRRQGVDFRWVVVVDGGLREEPTVELFVTPPGATPPQASPSVAPDGRR
jgi:hypothetical protein